MQSSSPCKHKEQAIFIDKGITVWNINIYFNGAEHWKNTFRYKSAACGFFRFIIPLKQALAYELEEIGQVTLHPGHFDFLYLPDDSWQLSILEDSCIIIDCSFSPEVERSIQGYFMNALEASKASGKPFRLMETGFVSALVLEIAYDLINSTILDPFKHIYTELKALELVVHLLQIICRQAEPTLLNLKPYDLERLFYIKDFLQTQALKHLTLTMIAREAGLNEFKLKKGFKALFGLTVFAFIIKLRMKNALKLMMENHSSIKEIAYQSGYRNPAYFTTSFKKFHGQTPSEVKKGHLKQGWLKH